LELIKENYLIRS